MIQGADERDSNCIDFAKLNKSFVRNDRFLQSDIEPVDLSNMRIGVLEEFQVDEESQRSREVQQKVIDALQK